MNHGLTVLSVDWDYFFPSMQEYDWNMKEELLFYEFLWETRYYHIGLKNRKPAYETMIPNYWGFFKKVLANSDIKQVVITDSHKDIRFYTDRGVSEIWNFDQHHDCGYGAADDEKELDCGNWASWLLNDISSYHLVYPKWRKDISEENLPENVDVHFGIPDEIISFDTIFICRSSCFTPSWCDFYFLDFINYLRVHYTNIKATAFALRPRKFSIETANKYYNADHHDVSTQRYDLFCGVYRERCGRFFHVS